MPLEERFLAARSEHPVNGLARVGQAKREQIAGHQLAGQTHRHVAEVDLRLVTRKVRLRHERLHRGLARGREDLRLPVGDVAPDHLIGDIGAVLLDQPVEDPGDRVPLLARRVEVRPKHLVDHRLVGIQRRRPRRKLLAGLRPDRVHGLLHGPPRHVVLALKLAHLHTGTVITPDRRVQLDLGHLRHDQDLSPGASRCCPGKYPSAVETREHHPTVDPGASQTREQLTALLVNKATVGDVVRRAELLRNSSQVVRL